MRSLPVKLTLAFLFIGLTGAVLVSVILSLTTRNAFNQFIGNREQQSLADSLVQYYQQHGSWDGVASYIPSITNAGSNPPPNGGGPGFPADNFHFTLVSADRTILFGGPPNQKGQQQVSSQDLSQAITLKDNGKTIGWLVMPQGPRQWTPTSPEGMFLSNVNQATLLSALGAAALALLLGGVLAFTMTRSLQELTAATGEIARGKFGSQVKVRSKDELGVLANSFNQMSRDLDRALQARRQMTADIAHDLRSPLSVISGYAEALSDGKLSGTPEVYGILYQETLHLRRLVDDLRTLSLADAGELSLNLQPTDPRALLERVAARQAVAAQNKGITLSVTADPDLPLADLDMERMAQVFDNLVGNAFRYTPEGNEIALGAKAEDGTLLMEVRDTGSGIAAEDLPYIFDRFYRADRSRHESGESGLGLAIARSIVEAHGGTITVESTPGQGTTFTIRLKM